MRELPSTSSVYARAKMIVWMRIVQCSYFRAPRGWVPRLGKRLGSGFGLQAVRNSQVQCWGSHVWESPRFTVWAPRFGSIQSSRFGLQSLRCFKFQGLASKVWETPRYSVWVPRFVFFEVRGLLECIAKDAVVYLHLWCERFAIKSHAHSKLCF